MESLQPQWEPTRDDVRNARITDFASWVEREYSVSVPDYHSLWRWSVEHLDDFWRSVWDYFGLRSATPVGEVLAQDRMPGAVWFPGVRLNYVDQVLRNERSDRPAIVYSGETAAEDVTMSWAELRRQAGALAATLRANGVGPGDRVVGYLPNIPETVVAFLATASLGAIWAACGQDYAVAAAHARFEQLEPAALITADGYYFNGKCRDNTANAANLLELLPSVRLAI